MEISILNSFTCSENQEFFSQVDELNYAIYMDDYDDKNLWSQYNSSSAKVRLENEDLKNFTFVEPKE